MKMDSEEALEEPGATLEVAERAVAEKGRLVHEEQAGGHDSRETHNASMGLLVGGEIIGFEGDGESGSLTEAESHAFAGDGVDGAGGVADEGDVGAGYAVEGSSESDGSARRSA